MSIITATSADELVAPDPAFSIWMVKEESPSVAISYVSNAYGVPEAVLLFPLSLGSDQIDAEVVDGRGLSAEDKRSEAMELAT
jgi:hypothetical protein